MVEKLADDNSFDQGDVVWHRGLFKSNARPWFVLSDDRHPFHGEEYVAVGLTTTKRREATRLDTNDWAVGGLPRTSYVSPWFLTTLKHADIDQGVGAVAETTTQTIVTEVLKYIQ